MTQVKWLLEPQVFQQDSMPFIDALVSMGIEHKVCRFGQPYENLLDEFGATDCVVFHGSLQLARLIQRKTDWVPGVYCNLPKFECLYYYPRFGRHLLNSEYVMLPFGELTRRKEWLFSTLGKDDCLFLRPSSGFKTFTGQVVERVYWEKDIMGLSYRIDQETLVLATRPIEVLREWRLVVTDRVIASTQYKEGKGLIRIVGEDITKVCGAPENVLSYGQQILNEVKYRPDPIWTLDICETASGELKVIEVGSFSCAGLYACDPKPIIETVNEIALRDYDSI